MRILVISSLYPPHFLGGYELYCRDRVEDWRATGEDVRVLTSRFRLPGTDDPLEPDIHRELLSVASYGCDGRRRPLRSFRVARQNNRVVARHLAEFRPDAVCYWNMVGFSSHLFDVVSESEIPAVAVVCSDWPNRLPGIAGRGRRARALIARLLRQGSVCGVQFHFDSRDVGKWLFVSAFQRSRALEAGLDVRGSAVCLAGVRLDLFPAVGVKDWTWNLLYAGRVEERKGVHQAVSALALLPSDARLSVVGRPAADYEASLHDLARRAGVNDRVTWIRQIPQDRVSDTIGAADALVLPFQWPEPSGGVILEAMATGTPVICTGTGGSGEYLQHGSNALVVEPRSPRALADAVDLLAHDADLRARLRDGGLETATRLSSQAWSRDVLQHIRDNLTPT